MDRTSILLSRPKPSQDIPKELHTLSTCRAKPTNARGDFRCLALDFWQSFYCKFNNQEQSIYEKFDSSPRATADTSTSDNQTTNISNDELVAIMTSCAQFVADKLDKDHDIDVGFLPDSVRENLERAHSEAEGSGEIDSAVAGFTPAEVQRAIDNFIVELHAILLPSYGVEIDSVIFDSEFYLGSRSRCKKKNVQATPAWTGLTVKKKSASVASNRHSSINRHGGSSSVTSGKRQHLRMSENKLQKGSDGKYRKRQHSVSSFRLSSKRP
jgi:hypothetical protein